MYVNIIRQSMVIRKASKINDLFSRKISICYHSQLTLFHDFFTNPKLVYTITRSCSLVRESSSKVISNELLTF
jgi:hypothetical protein